MADLVHRPWLAWFRRLSLTRFTGHG
jgi:hypothetical protein